LVRAQADIRHFAPLFTDVSRVKPDILVVESGLLAERWDQEDSLLRQHSVYTRWLTKLSRHRNNPFIEVGIADLLNNKLKEVRWTSEEHLHHISMNRRQLAPSAIAGETAQLQKMVGQGIRVLVVEVPRSRQLASLGDRDGTGQAGYRWQDLSFAGEVPSAYYYDQSHMKPAGRDLFMRHFIAGLRRSP